MEKEDARRSVISEEEEARIIRECADGNWEEFSLIFEEYKDKVYFLALSVLKERALALDATQETFIKVFRSLKKFSKRAGFSTWLYRIAYNQALDQYRRLRRRGEIEFNEETAPHTMRSSGRKTFTAIAERELGDSISDAIDSLPLKLRTAVILKYVEGLTYTEVCGILGCARGVLQKRLKQADTRLRAMLRDEILDLQGRPGEGRGETG